MKYLFIITLLMGLNVYELKAADTNNMVKGDIVAQNAYNETIYIPKEWGGLKSVTNHGSFDVLYFESSEGVVYAVAVYVSSVGRIAFSRDASDFDQYDSNSPEIEASKILRK